MDQLFPNLSHLMNFRKQMPEEAFSELITKILTALPGLGWELGPDLVDPQIDRLSLSVRNAPEFMEKSALVDGLPLMGDGWIIDLGIPPRDWEIYFEATINGRDLDVEGREWSWNMVDAGDSVALKIGVPVNKFQELGGAELTDIAEIIVNGELGEINVLKFVKSIEVIRMEDVPDQWFSMANLRKKFVEKFPACEYSTWLSISRREEKYQADAPGRAPEAHTDNGDFKTWGSRGEKK